jgi:hypothetical protein
VVSLRPWSLYARVKMPRYASSRNLSGPQGRYECFGRKKLLPMPGFEPRIDQPVAYSLHIVEWHESYSTPQDTYQRVHDLTKCYTVIHPREVTKVSFQTASHRTEIHVRLSECQAQVLPTIRSLSQRQHKTELKINWHLCCHCHRESTWPTSH